MNPLAKLFFTLTGGRPMRLIVNHYFVDKVTGRWVNIYRDRLYGFEWMAISPWEPGRVWRNCQYNDDLVNKHHAPGGHLMNQVTTQDEQDATTWVFKR